MICSFPSSTKNRRCGSKTNALHKSKTTTDTQAEQGMRNGSVKCQISGLAPLFVASPTIRYNSSSPSNATDGSACFNTSEQLTRIYKATGTTPCSVLKNKGSLTRSRSAPDLRPPVGESRTTPAAGN